jgi:hypothetical protein
MGNVITYDYVSRLLNSVSFDNKLTFVQFQQIFSYLYEKVEISLKVIKKKSLITYSISLVSDIMSKLELIIQQNLIAEPDTKDIMLMLLENLKKEVKDWYGHSS